MVRVLIWLLCGLDVATDRLSVKFVYEGRFGEGSPCRERAAEWLISTGHRFERVLLLADHHIVLGHHSQPKSAFPSLRRGWTQSEREGRTGRPVHQRVHQLLGRAPPRTSPKVPPGHKEIELALSDTLPPFTKHPSTKSPTTWSSVGQQALLQFSLSRPRA